MSAIDVQPVACLEELFSIVLDYKKVLSIHFVCFVLMSRSHHISQCIHHLRLFILVAL